MYSLNHRVGCGLLASFLVCLSGAAMASAAPWLASPEIVRAAPGSSPAMVRGHVFEDLSGDGRRQPEEPGIPGVLVSNGIEVVVTDADGAWALPAHDDMNLFVIQPSGWRVPVDEHQVPQFFHVQKREGTPLTLRFGGLLAHVPEDRLVVVATHIPLVAFTDPWSRQHQTDNATDLYALLEGRPVLSLSGHTHTVENHAPGQSFEGWREAVNVASVPFRHIIAGAASGAWWLGDFDIDGIPMALQRDGAPKGVLELAFDGADYRERYLGARLDPARVQWLSFNTPAFRDWMTRIVEWSAIPSEARDPLPPLTISDLADTRLFTPGDLAEGVWLTANVWLGSAETRVTVDLNGAPAGEAERSQQGEGEAVRAGVEWADPFSAMRQLSVARFALQSRSGEPRHQGFEGFRGVRFGPAPPQPIPGPGAQARVTDRTSHLWRWRLPADLAPGVHRLEVITTDRHGASTRERLVFEVALERPPAHWRHEAW